MAHRLKDAEWLAQRYTIERLDCVQIGAIVGRDPKTVWSWLRRHNISTRPRGSNAAANLLNGRPHGYRHCDATKERLKLARLTDGHFPRRADGLPYWTGKSGQQHPVWNGGSTPERQAFYSTAEWKKAYASTWKRADAKCERCGKNHRGVNRSKEKFHVHHIMPFTFKRFRALVRNLALLCADCHRFVHSARNGNREFLPPFGKFPNDDGKLISISYRPKCKGTLPSWM